ncbi:hypothetical protein KFL_010860040, partial [Klebsormidium nitens]
MEPVVEIPLEPRASGALRVAPLADRDPESVAVAAYRFFQALEEDPTSKALLLPGSTSADRLVVDPGAMVRLELAFKVPESTVPEYRVATLLLLEAMEPVVEITFEPRESGALKVAPFAESDPERVAEPAYTFFQAFEDAPTSYALLVPGSTSADRLVVDPAPTVRLEFAMRVPESTVAEYSAVARLLLEQMGPVVEIPLEPRASGALNVAPLADRDPES